MTIWNRFRLVNDRKPMRPNPVAPWELRIHELRVEQPDPLVTILAVGIKQRNCVRIGGKEFDL